MFKNINIKNIIHSEKKSKASLEKNNIKLKFYINSKETPKLSKEKTMLSRINKMEINIKNFNSEITNNYNNNNNNINNNSKKKIYNNVSDTAISSLTKKNRARQANNNININNNHKVNYLDDINKLKSNTNSINCHIINNNNNNDINFNNGKLSMVCNFNENNELRNSSHKKEISFINRIFSSIPHSIECNSHDNEYEDNNTNFLYQKNNINENHKNHINKRNNQNIIHNNNNFINNNNMNNNINNKIESKNFRDICNNMNNINSNINNINNIKSFKYKSNNNNFHNIINHNNLNSNNLNSNNNINNNNLINCNNRTAIKDTNNIFNIKVNKFKKIVNDRKNVENKIDKLLSNKIIFNAHNSSHNKNKNQKGNNMSYNNSKDNIIINMNTDSLSPFDEINPNNNDNFDNNINSNKKINKRNTDENKYITSIVSIKNNNEKSCPKFNLKKFCSEINSNNNTKNNTNEKNTNDNNNNICNYNNYINEEGRQTMINSINSIRGNLSHFYSMANTINNEKNNINNNYIINNNRYISNSNSNNILKNILQCGSPSIKYSIEKNNGTHLRRPLSNMKNNNNNSKDKNSMNNIDYNCNLKIKNRIKEDYNNNEDKLINTINFRISTQINNENITKVKNIKKLKSMNNNNNNHYNINNNNSISNTMKKKEKIKSNENNNHNRQLITGNEDSLRIKRSIRFDSDVNNNNLYDSTHFINNNSCLNNNENNNTSKEKEKQIINSGNNTIKKGRNNHHSNNIKPKNKLSNNTSFKHSSSNQKKDIKKIINNNNRNQKKQKEEITSLTMYNNSKSIKMLINDSNKRINSNEKTNNNNYNNNNNNNNNINNNNNNNNKEEDEVSKVEIDQNKIIENISQNTLIMYSIYIITKYYDDYSKIGLMKIKLFDDQKNEIPVICYNTNAEYDTGKLFNCKMTNISLLNNNDKEAAFISEFKTNIYINFYINESSNFQYLKIVNYLDKEEKISPVKKIKIFKGKTPIFNGELKENKINSIKIKNYNGCNSEKKLFSSNKSKNKEKEKEKEKESNKSSKITFKNKNGTTIKGQIDKKFYSARNNLNNFSFNEDEQQNNNNNNNNNINNNNEINININDEDYISKFNNDLNNNIVNDNNQFPFENDNNNNDDILRKEDLMSHTVNINDIKNLNKEKFNQLLFNQTNEDKNPINNNIYFRDSFTNTSNRININDMNTNNNNTNNNNDINDIFFSSFKNIFKTCINPKILNIKEDNYFNMEENEKILSSTTDKFNELRFQSKLSLDQPTMNTFTYNSSEGIFTNINNNNITNNNNTFSNYTEFNKIRFIITSNYGHHKYVGLTGIEFYNIKGDLINVETALTIGALPKDLRTIYDDDNDHRIFENTFNNVNNTNDPDNMWVTKLKKNDPYTFIEICFNERIKLSKIKIYNYNEKDKLEIGAKTIEIYLDDMYFKTIFLKPGIGEMAFDYIPISNINNNNTNNNNNNYLDDSSIYKGEDFGQDIFFNNFDEDIIWNKNNKLRNVNYFTDSILNNNGGMNNKNNMNINNNFFINATKTFCGGYSHNNSFINSYNNTNNNKEIKYASFLYTQCYETPFMPCDYYIKFEFISNYYKGTPIQDDNNLLEYYSLGLDKIEIYNEEGVNIIDNNNSNNICTYNKNKYKIISNREIFHIENNEDKNKIILNGTQNGDCNNCLFYLFDKDIYISYIKLFPLTKEGNFSLNSVKEIKIFSGSKIIFEGELYKDQETIILFTCDMKITKNINEKFLTKSENYRDYEETINDDCKTLILK